MKHRRNQRKQRSQRRQAVTLALIVITVALISSASTWVYMTYSTPASTAGRLVGQQTASYANFDPTAIYTNSSDGVVTVDGVQTSTDITGPITSSILGSGFILNVNDTYYVVTNFHVVDGTSSLAVTFRDGNGYAARVVGSDAYSDLAVLSVPGASRTEDHALSLGNSGALVIGEPVLAIGNPYGLTGSVTVGIVSQLGRSIQESAAGNFSIADMIQFSAPINPGNSGGALLNRDGKVIGVTTAMVTSSQGLGFAIPSDTIRRELPYLIRTGSYNLHPYLGIAGVDMNYQLAQYVQTNVTYGVLIQHVVQGGPAAKAGLRGGTQPATILGEQFLLGGDIIVSINGKKIANNDGLATYLEENEAAGQSIQLGILRAGRLISLTLVLAQRPAPPSA